MEQEVRMLSSLVENPKRPFAVIIGGAKVSDKVDAVNNLLNMADKILIGGALANVFLKAEGREMGSSFIEDVFVDKKRREKKDWVVYAKEILEKYKGKIVLPEDLVISDGVSVRTIKTEEIPAGWMALDVGPETIATFSEIIKNSSTVFLAGPMGKFEDDRFAVGSHKVLDAVKNSEISILAGGDTIDVARRFGRMEEYTHVSLAGGATLEFLGGKSLPALTPLIA
jgi:3-phosphoglycerate kinase